MLINIWVYRVCKFILVFPFLSAPLFYVLGVFLGANFLCMIQNGMYQGSGDHMMWRLTATLFIVNWMWGLMVLLMFGVGLLLWKYL